MNKTKIHACICAGLSAALFAVLAGMMRGLEHCAGWGDALALALLFTLPAAAATAFYAVKERPSAGRLLFAGTLLGVLMAARATMLDFTTADYGSFLHPWTEVFREGGFAMLAQNVGDYNLVYQYFLLLVSKTPLHDLYLIKLLSVVFDYALAMVMMRAADHYAGKDAAVTALLLVPALPTVLLDGACWGQCDTVYVFFIVLALYLLETKRPMRSAAALAIAFAFKLQTIFFFPVVLLGLIHKRYKLRDAAVFFAAYLATMLPALLAGRPFMDALSVYANQSVGQYYDRLSYNAPTLYNLFPMMEFGSTRPFAWARYVKDAQVLENNEYLVGALMPALQNAALYACVALALMAVIYWLMHWREVTTDMTLNFALFCAIFLPFIMPKMHERYFFLADMLSVLYAFRRKDRRFMPLLVVGASFVSYMAYLMRNRPVEDYVLSLVMLGALAVAGYDLLQGMRAQRSKLAEGSVKA